MVEVSNLVAPSAEWWNVAIKGMRNSYKTTDKSDSGICKFYSDEDEGDNFISEVCKSCKYFKSEDVYCDIDQVENDVEYPMIFILGETDKRLLLKLCKAGTSHRKVLRQLPVIMDITAPLYWWKQMDCYSVGTTMNSESTMHTIMKDEFHEDDFSFDNLYPEEEREIVQNFNNIRTRYLKAVEEDVPSASKRAWGQLIELLPQSYNQKRTWSANYEVLLNIIQQRRNHKLSEWNDFIECLLENVPYLKEIVEAANE